MTSPWLVETDSIKILEELVTCNAVKQKSSITSDKRKATPVNLFIWGFTSFLTLYRSYHDGQLEGQRKPVHTVGQGSVL